MNGQLRKRQSTYLPNTVERKSPSKPTVLVAHRTHLSMKPRQLLTFKAGGTPGDSRATSGGNAVHVARCGRTELRSGVGRPKEVLICFSRSYLHKLG